MRRHSPSSGRREICVAPQLQPLCPRGICRRRFFFISSLMRSRSRCVSASLARIRRLEDAYGSDQPSMAAHVLYGAADFHQLAFSASSASADELQEGCI